MIKATKAAGLPPQTETVLDAVLTQFVGLKKTQRGAWTTPDLLDILQDMRMRMPPELRGIPPRIQFRWSGSASLALTWDVPSGPSPYEMPDPLPAYRVEWTYTDDGRVSRKVQTQGGDESLECCVTYALSRCRTPLPGFWTLV